MSLLRAVCALWWWYTVAVACGKRRRAGWRALGRSLRALRVLQEALGANPKVLQETDASIRAVEEELDFPYWLRGGQW